MFVDAIPTPVFWLDHNKVYQGCNQVFSDLIGLVSPADIVGLTNKDLPYSSSDANLRDEVFDAIFLGKIQAKILYDCVIGVQDRMIWVQKRFTPLKDPKGKIIGVFGAIIDISEKVNRRKDLETYKEHEHVIESFLNELISKSPLSTEKELIEKSIITLKDESQANQAILINANASSPQKFIQFSTEAVDVTHFFANRKILLKTTGQSGYLDPEAFKLFIDFEHPIESIFFYRMSLNDIIEYDDIILLVNPDKDKLEAGSVYLSLTHNIVHNFHVNRVLNATKQMSKT
jgi:hypothetical protein